jgi:hypothetical protein
MNGKVIHTTTIWLFYREQYMDGYKKDMGHLAHVLNENIIVQCHYLQAQMSELNKLI